ncbi:MAG: trypsin-like peptidase domain-containing protein [Spirochaetales bacterium]|nr:trypsin-like peptidase domain-containing protein [Spirochaetales bacterium]
MKQIFTITGIVLLLFVISACMTQKGVSERILSPLDGLSRQEINDRAIVQVLLLKNDYYITGGTGFFVNEEGYLVTAFHVIEFTQYEKDIEIFINDGNALIPARTIATDREKDLAVLSIEHKGPVPFVVFSDDTVLEPRSRIIFRAVPPELVASDEGTYLASAFLLRSDNHRIISFNNLDEMLSNPDTKDFVQDELLKNILFDPVTTSLISDPMSKKHLPYPRHTVDLLTFFLLDKESRIFFSDPDKKTRAGCSGGAAFSEAGFCVGMLQEILVVFRPNPKSRYIHTNQPPSDSHLFPLLDKMISAGQNASNISAFLGRNGIVHYKRDKYGIAFLDINH